MEGTGGGFIVLCSVLPLHAVPVEAGTCSPDNPLKRMVPCNGHGECNTRYGICKSLVVRVFVFVCVYQMRVYTCIKLYYCFKTPKPYSSLQNTHKEMDVLHSILVMASVSHPNNIIHYGQRETLPHTNAWMTCISHSLFHIKDCCKLHFF